MFTDFVVWQNVVTIDPLTKSCTLENSAAAGSGKVYQFDATFGTSSTTESVYENVGSVIVEAVLEGYNGTVFAYGQTGCGKSYTMRGFIERALEHLFEATSTASSETRYYSLVLSRRRINEIIVQNIKRILKGYREKKKKNRFVISRCTNKNYTN